MAQTVKNLPAVRETHSIPGLGKPPEEGYGNPLQYSCLEKPMDRGAWRAWVQSMGSQSIGHDWVTNTSRFHCLAQWNPVCLVWKQKTVQKEKKKKKSIQWGRNSQLFWLLKGIASCGRLYMWKKPFCHSKNSHEMLQGTGVTVPPWEIKLGGSSWGREGNP